MKKRILILLSILAVFMAFVAMPGIDVMAFTGDFLTNPYGSAMTIATVAIGMAPEAEKALFDKLQENIKKNVSELLDQKEKGLLTKEMFTTKMDEINKSFENLSDKYVEKSFSDDLQKQVDAMNAKLDQMNMTNKQANGMVDEIVQKGVDLLKVYKEKGRATIEFETKSGAVDFGITTTTGTGIPQGEREAGISYAPERPTSLLNVIRSTSITSPTLEWVEKTDEAGKPAFKKEFEKFPKRSWKSTLKSVLAKKIAVIAEYSKEILEDVDFFQAEMRRDLVEQIQLVLEDNILNGTGGGSADADLKGILEYAQAWNNGTFTVASPSTYDVIAVGVNQIAEEHHRATHIMMSPGTAMAMKLTKDKNENYVMPPFAAANGVQVEGLPVLTSTLFKANEILIMDASKVLLAIRRNWQLEFSDSHDDNFAHDVLASRLSGRFALRIKDTDAKAFVYVANVNTAKTALTPSS